MTMIQSKKIRYHNQSCKARIAHKAEQVRMQAYFQWGPKHKDGCGRGEQNLKRPQRK